MGKTIIKEEDSKAYIIFNFDEYKILELSQKSQLVFYIMYNSKVLGLKSEACSV